MSDPISPSTPNDIAGRSQGKSDIFLRAKDLVHRAYQLPSKQRDQLINAECAGESELRSEVAWMLDALRSPDEHFLESPVLEDGSESISELNVPKGRKYALLKALGEGGSGTVYLAERMENGTRQMVAVKLLSLMALSNKIAVSHFLRERALLAGLNHPGIARLIDAGALEDGQPFLAMEYVEGQTIERYCDNPQLSLSARLHIFLKICDAVQYAHNQLIIHRDIKPSNILVTEQGEPKLVDFGIATHIAGSQSDVTITATRNNMMSVFYASPEQIAGDALATSTDIYSLGVLLYELTTGISPWKKHDVSAALALRSVTHEPELPSYAYKRKQKDGARGGGLWKFNKFPSDLDAILLKALRHRPQDRYLSVEAMVADINRFLGHYAVQARQGQRTYRLQKYLYRHWAAMATTSLVVLLSIGFGIDRSIQLDRTRAEVAKVKEVSNFLSDLLTQPMPEVAQGREVSARALVDHGADRLRRLLDADPATKIALLNTLARTYLGLGVLNQGSELSEQAVMLARESPGISRQQLMDTLLNSANVERLLPRAAMVEKYAREAIDLGERDRTIKPIDLAAAMQWLAYAELLQGMPLERIQTDYQKCFSLMNTVAPQSVELALAQTNSLYAMGYLGKPEDGWVFQQSAGRLTEHLLGPSHPETWRSKSISGLLLTQLGEELQADDLLKKVLTAQLSLLGREHAQTIITMRFLAMSANAQGKWAEAEKYAREHLALTRKVRYYESFPTYYALLTEAEALAGMRQFDESQRLSKEAEFLAEKVFAPADISRWRAVAQIFIAQAQFGNGELQKAKDRLQEVLSNLPDMSDTVEYRIRAWKTLGQIAAAQSDQAGAEKAFKIGIALAPIASAQQPAIALEFGRFLIERGQFKEAAMILGPLTERLERRMPPDAPILENARAALLYAQKGA